MINDPRLSVASLNWESAMRLAHARVATWDRAPDYGTGYDTRGSIAMLILASAWNETRGGGGEFKIINVPPKVRGAPVDCITDNVDHRMFFDVINELNRHEATKWQALGVRVEALAITDVVKWPAELGDAPHRCEPGLQIVFPWQHTFRLP